MSVVVIPASMGSKRLPGKLMLKINGIPLITRVANRCLKSNANKVIVATDHRDIAQVCSSVRGLEVVMTNHEIFSGSDRVADAVKNIDDNVIVNVQGDEPFIEPELINRIIFDLENSDCEIMNSAYTKIDKENACDPNAVKVVFDQNKYALYFSRAVIPYDRDGKENVCYHKHLGIYGYHRNVLMKYHSFEQSMLERIEKLEQLRALENGIRIKLLESTKDFISINSAEDVKLAENLSRMIDND